MTAIPFANGLLIVNTRLLVGNAGEGDFGFRFDVPSFRLQNPWINARFLIEDARATITAAMCGTTYFNLETLNEVQSDYYYAFNALKEAAGEEAVGALSFLTFAPNMAHEKWGEFTVKAHLHPRRDRVQALLEAGWLKTDYDQSPAYLLPFDAKAN